MRKWIVHRGLGIVLAATVLLAACTASRPPTPTPPPALAGGAAEATQRPTHTATLPPTATQEPSPTPTPNLTATEQAQQVAATATAQAEREQAEKQLWQEIEQLQQFFKEGYSYTLEEPYQLRVDVSTSAEMVIAGLVTQELQFIQLENKSLWDWLTAIGRLAEQAGYRMELHVNGTIYLHEDGGAKYPIHLEDWVAKARRGRLNFVRWPIEGPGVRIIESQYMRVATYGFLTDPAGLAKEKIHKRQGEGEHQYELYIVLKAVDSSPQEVNDPESMKKIKVGAVHIFYNGYYEVNYSKGHATRLELLPNTTFQLAAP